MPPPDPCKDQKKAKDRADRAANRANKAQSRTLGRYNRESSAAARERAAVGGCFSVDSGGDIVVDNDCISDHMAEADEHQAEADALFEEWQDAMEEYLEALEDAGEAAGDYCDCLEENEED
jgi:ATP phosphoribosyltransferase regulatory subunit HisZ